MLEQLKLGVDSIIDVCLMKGDNVVYKVERDLFQAWDKARSQGLGGKADDPSGEQAINSPQAYGERCVAEMGEIPFFDEDRRRHVRDVQLPQLDRDPDDGDAGRRQREGAAGGHAR